MLHNVRLWLRPSARFAVSCQQLTIDNVRISWLRLMYDYAQLQLKLVTSSSVRWLRLSLSTLSTARWYQFMLSSESDVRWLRLILSNESDV